LFLHPGNVPSATRLILCTPSPVRVGACQESYRLQRFATSKRVRRMVVNNVFKPHTTPQIVRRSVRLKRCSRDGGVMAVFENHAGFVRRPRSRSHGSSPANHGSCGSSAPFSFFGAGFLNEDTALVAVQSRLDRNSGCKDLFHYRCRRAAASRHLRPSAHQLETIKFRDAPIMGAALVLNN
jgi:hypothetical protein